MTELNKKNFEMISSLRNKFLKLRILTEEEEFTGKLKIFFYFSFHNFTFTFYWDVFLFVILAGKFSQMGKKIEAVKKTLTKNLKRSPSDEEWAAACNLTVSQLTMYQSEIYFFKYYYYYYYY